MQVRRFISCQHLALFLYMLPFLRMWKSSPNTDQQHHLVCEFASTPEQRMFNNFRERSAELKMNARQPEKKMVRKQKQKNTTRTRTSASSRAFPRRERWEIRVGVPTAVFSGWTTSLLLFHNHLLLVDFIVLLQTTSAVSQRRRRQNQPIS